MPLFLVPLIAWLADNFTTRAWRFAAATFFLGALMAAVGVLVGLVAGLAVVVPDPVSQAMAILMPLDWAAQASIVLAVNATVYAWTIFKQAFEVATR